MSSKERFVFDDFLDFVEGESHRPERAEGTPPLTGTRPIEQFEIVTVGERLQPGDGTSIATVAQGVSTADLGDVESGKTAGDLRTKRVWFGHEDRYIRWAVGAREPISRSAGRHSSGARHFGHAKRVIPTGFICKKSLFMRGIM